MFSCCLLGAIGCTGDIVTELVEMPVVIPGETIPMRTKVKVFDNGTYYLSPEAQVITTHCHGTVTVSFTPAEGASQSNTCHSDLGGSNQTNLIGGADHIVLTLAPGSWAKVILN